jgi:Holliday junction resolvasome RuvABC endonuclease subunit
LLDHGVIRLKEHRPIEQRLFDLREEVLSLALRASANNMYITVTHFAIERAFGGKFPAVTLALGRLDGVLRELAWELTSKPAITLTATVVRGLIGSKTKARTQEIVAERFNLDLDKEPYDVSDAIALGWAALTRVRIERRE